MDLEHHGIKGQKWGVVNEDETNNNISNDTSELSGLKTKVPSLNEKKISSAYKKVPDTKPSKKDAEQTQVERQAAALSHIKPSEASSSKTRKKLTPKQKKILYSSIGIGSAAVILAGGYKYSKIRNDAEIAKNGKKFLDDLDLTGMKTNAEKNWYSLEFSDSSKLGKFKSIQNKAREKSFNSSAGIFSEHSYSRPEFELPKGHQFHRVSLSSENGHNDVTYATHNINDFNRYLTGFGQLNSNKIKFDFQEVPTQHISWTAKESIRIPSLTTSLETMRESMSRLENRQVSREEALKMYGKSSGGAWNDANSKAFIKALREKGYHGIIDENNAGIYADSPVVLFAKDLMSNKTSNLLTKDEAFQAVRDLLPLSNPKI